MSGLNEDFSKFESQDICGDDLGVIDRNLDIPEGIRFYMSQINSETIQEQGELKSRILDNFIRSSILVSSGNKLFDNYIYNEIFALLYAGLLESRGGLENITFPDYVLRDIFMSALELYNKEYPNDFIKYAGDATEIQFGKQIINISLLVEHIILRNRENISPDDRKENPIKLQKEEKMIDFLDSQGLPDSSKKIIISLLSRKGVFRIGIEDGDLESIYNNLDVLIRFIVWVESSGGKNIENQRGSSAKGPFQYLDGFIDGKPTMIQVKDDEGNPVINEAGQSVYKRKYDRSIGEYSPFDTALRRNMEYYASMSEDYEGDYYNHSKYQEYIPKWVINSYENQPEKSPLNLSWEESINMFLVDNFSRDETMGYLCGILIDGDSTDMKRFYNEVHHTAPNTKVNDNVQQHFDTFATQLTQSNSMIFSTHHPPRRSIRE